ncbi:MAG: septal ring lytic transglycosylase RlpA family protein [Cyclobacteriaceae bacterium]|nr:septal ring lytic transglycosylase RlpA family protein [Cyclobacteriaceae bacterium]
MKTKVSFFVLFLFIAAGVRAQSKTQTGIASYYADKFVGRTTANGEKYSHHKLTAAHKTLPFGTKVRVTNLENGKKVIVRINDRGPFVKGRIIDLSKSAARKLDFIEKGLAKVSVEVVK